MGSVWDRIDNVIGDLITGGWSATIRTIDTIYDVATGGSFWQGIKRLTIEPIMNAFGLEDETLFNASIATQRVFNDDNFFDDTLIKLNLDRVKNGGEITDFITSFVDYGAAQINDFYNRGETDFVDYLPTAQVNGYGIDSSTIESVIENMEDELVNITYLNYSSVTDEDWIYWYLQENNSFSIDMKTLTYQNQYYLLNSYEYSLTDRQYIVGLDRITATTTTVSDTTTIIITRNDDTTDNKRTVIERTTDIVSTSTDNPYKLYINTVTLSDVTVQIPKDTENSSQTITTISSTPTTYSAGSITINVPMHSTNKHYVVYYMLDASSINKIFLYDPVTETSHPELKVAGEILFKFDMMPVVTLRNGFFSVNEYNATSKKIDDVRVYKPATLTAQRKEQTDKLLNSVGIDSESLLNGIEENPDIEHVQDAFLMWGVSPADTHPIVSKVLYETFNWIYDKVPTGDAGNPFSATFEENPYNTAVMWTTMPTTITDEVIGSQGTYKHEIQVDTIEITVTEYNYTRFTPSSSNIPGFTFNQRGTCTRVQGYFERVYKNTRTGEIKATESWYRKETNEDYGGSTSSSPSSSGDCSEQDNSKVVSTDIMYQYNLYLKKQISATQVRTISIMDVTNLNAIKRGIIEDIGPSTAIVIQPLTSTDFIIPISYYIANSLTLIDRVYLMQRGLYMVFYAAQAQTVKWYQTTRFAQFLTVIAVIITIIIIVLSWGTATVPAAAVISTIQSLVISIGVSLAIKLIFKYVAQDWLKIVAAVAVAIAARNASGLANSTSGLMTAIDLLAITTQVTDMYLGEKFEALESKRGNLNRAYQNRLEEFEAIAEKFEQGLSLEDLVQITIRASTEIDGIMGQSPTYFYWAAKDAYKDYNLLFSGNYDSQVEDFFNDKLQIGPIGE